MITGIQGGLFPDEEPPKPKRPRRKKPVRYDDRCHARATDPVTAHLSAARVNPAGIDATIEKFLRLHPTGLTSYEIAALSGIPLISVSPRLRPMTRKGIVRDSGKTREGDTGHKRIVWILNE